MGCGISQTSSRSKLLIIVGPSGVGKGTLINKLKTQYHDKIVSKISHTTRYMREGEENGKHYYFITEQEFNKVKYF